MADREGEAVERSAESLRIDKWLWCARFFRSRALAQQAVAGGHVHVNGERTKPARAVRIGDRLTITRGDDRIEVVVRDIPVRRGPAAEARLCYEETAESLLAREYRREAARLAGPTPAGRPEKHDRRALRRLRGR
ncbi:MAG TPA: S4 domain-containing protein [Steroidobacteraceae bacterium]|nr:S4 domain-containing protein [Steroidobacteraceae bacterium]